MPETGSPLQPASWLQHLHAAGQWGRLEEISRQRLAAEPADACGHYHRAWALLRLNRAPEMQPHVEHLLREDPEDVDHLKLAALWHLTANRNARAKSHLDSALALDPDEASVHYLLAVLASRQGKFKKAQAHAARARSLDPDDADYAQLDVELRSIGKETSADALNTIRELEEALRLEPDNARVMAGIGDVWLDSLEQPGRAEEMYRQALAIDPSDKGLQRKLWNAIQARNLFFRTLRIPIQGLQHVCAIARGLVLKPWYILVFIIAFKFVLGYLAWLLAAAVVFAPPAWFFEWLVLMDIRRADRWSRHVGGWWLRFHLLPFYLRFGLCLALVGAFWWALFLWVGIPAPLGFILVGVFFAVHFLLMLLYVACRKYSAWRAARRITR
jgi:tetratricopeptide (TPR) repeat protein